MSRLKNTNCRKYNQCQKNNKPVHPAFFFKIVFLTEHIDNVYFS